MRGRCQAGHRPSKVSDLPAKAILGRFARDFHQPENCTNWTQQDQILDPIYFYP